MAQFNEVRIRGHSGSVCSPHPVTVEALELPETTITPTRVSCRGHPFLFRGIEAASYERSLGGALIEEARRRRGNFTPDQYPIWPERLEGSVRISVWEYRNLDLINATLQGICDEFGARTSIVDDPAGPLDYEPWRKLFHWVYMEREWPGGVVMPSAAGEDLTSIIVPREIALDPDHFECVHTAVHDIPPEAIDHVLGLARLPDGWTPQ